MKKKQRNAKPDSLPTGRPARAACFFVAFAAGWTVMMLEILGGRLLAPYFGYSIYQWGALIGVVLGFMAVGYFIGGRLGDRPQAYGGLVLALSASMLWVLLSPWLGGSPLEAARGLGPIGGAILASALLLGPPSLLLALVSPIVARLTARGGIASAAGTVYGVSTVGSIGGTFFAAFFAIPEIGTRASYFLAAGLLLISIVLLLWIGRQLRLAPAPAVALLALLVPPPDELPGLYQRESIHNIIRVEDRDGIRLLYLNYRDGAQSLERKGELLTDGYYDYFLLGPQLAGGADSLFLGAAGGVALKQHARVWPGSRVVGVELDPAVIEVARDFFGLSELPEIELVAEDARWYVRETRERFDVAAIDLYVTGHIPFFTTTTEFFQELQSKLEHDGVLIMNVLSLQPGDDLIGPLVNTVRQAFASTFLIGWGNVMLVATKSPRSLAQIRARLKAEDLPDTARVVARRALETLRQADPDPAWPVFTDDLNDVEFRSFRMFYGG